MALATVILPTDCSEKRAFFNALISRLLLILSGVEQNPGPGPEEPNSGHKYQHKSGAQKRTKQRQGLLDLARSDPKQRKISFSSTPSPQSAESRRSLTPDFPSSPLGSTSTFGGSTDSVFLLPESPAPAALAANRPPSSCGDADGEASCSSATEDIVPAPASPDPASTEGDGDGIDVSFQLELLPDKETCYVDDVFSAFEVVGALSDQQKTLLKNCHPVQPENNKAENIKLPFDPSRVYFSEVANDKVRREWLSYCSTRRKVFCWVCRGFAVKLDGKFSYSGWGNEVKYAAGHIYGAVNKHEATKEHISATQSFFAFCKGNAVNQCSLAAAIDLKKRQVLERREVMLRIINIVLHLAKQGSAFRGSRTEAAYTLPLPCNHGNFLEEVKSRAVYDPVLKAHLEKVTMESKERHAKNPDSRGRGALVTFLSASTFKKLLTIIYSMIQKKIRNLILANGGKFSISLDGCQDISVKEILALVVRYVDEFGPVEVLLDVSAASHTSGEALLKYVLDILKKVGLDLSNLIGYSFDGAGNMAGVHRGLQARLKELVPNSVFQHCYAHVLNLILQKSCNTVVEAESLFALLRDTATALSESYKRTNLWKEITKFYYDNYRLLVKFGKTRWWAKAKSCNRIFLQETSLLPIILTLIEIITNHTNLIGSVRAKLLGLLKKWCSFETVAVGVLFQKIFALSGPVSDYLQGTQLDHVQAARLTANLIPSMAAIDVEVVLEEAKILAEKCNAKLDEVCESSQFKDAYGEIFSRTETECPRRRIPLVTRRSGEKASKLTKHKTKLIFILNETLLTLTLSVSFFSLLFFRR